MQNKNQTFNLKSLLIFILIPLLGGTLIGLISRAGGNYDFIKPSFYPPNIIFPIMWNILYILMGTASYSIYLSDSCYRKKGLLFYFIQLAVNLLWPLIFFNLENYLFTFIILIVLLVLVIITTYYFFKSNKAAGYLIIPYILWLVFAGILNLSIVILN